MKIEYYEEISKLYREFLYTEYEKFDDSQIIHYYRLLRDMVDIFTQMVNGRKFDEEYLKNKFKYWGVVYEII